MGSVRYQVVEDGDYRRVEELHKVVVHRFRISDVDDPEIYAAEPIWEWQQSDAGKFIMQHAVEQPVFHKAIDYAYMGYEYVIVAEIEKKKLTEYYLKFGPLK
jgi:hypothetical protein